MPQFLEADTSHLLEMAQHLDPAPAFWGGVARVSDEIVAFCTDVEAGIQAYASVARDSAGLYGGADGTNAALFGGSHGRG